MTPRELSTRPGTVWVRQWGARWKAAAHAALGGKCGRCGFADERALQIDHVRGDGCRESRGATHGQKVSLGTYYKHVVAQADSGRYQLLCANCNWIKRVENKEHS
jgi:hypothetical protein